MMGELDVRFHGICTHVPGMITIDGRALHRVVLLRCNEPGSAPHRPLLSVPRSASIDPECPCIEEIFFKPDDVNRHFRLDGVHLQVPGARGLLHYDQHWECGVPKLKTLYPALGPIDDAKVSRVSQELPYQVSAWFDVTAGVLEPYESLKGAVAVRLLTTFQEQEPIRMTATCWYDSDTTWTFTLPSGSKVCVSNDCGTAGDSRDFLIHYRIAKTGVPEPPLYLPTPVEIPACLPPRPSWADAPPGDHNVSLGCSNSGYP